MRLWPRTLFGQMLLALLFGIALSHALGFWVLVDERERFFSHVAEVRVGERIAGVVTAFDVADPDGRKRLERSLNRLRVLHVTTSEPWRTLDRPPSDDARRLQELIARGIDRPVTLQVVSIHEALLEHRHPPFGGPEGGPPPPPPPPDVDHPSPDARSMPDARGSVPPGPGGPPPGSPERAGPPGPPRSTEPAGPGISGGPGAPGGPFGPPGPHRVVLQYEVQARLGDGAVVTVNDLAIPTPEDSPWRLAGWLAIVVASVAALAALLVRRVTRPLQQIALAAGRLGRNLELAPVPQTGPLETQRAAEAFNRMQDELKRTLAARTQALAGLSHDLRLPLTRVRLRLESLDESTARTGIESDLAEMDEMIGHTLDYLRAGPTAEPFAPIDLDALIDSLIDDCEATGAEVVREGSAGAPVSGQAHALRRCFENLIDNARRYAKTSIQVTVHDFRDRVEVAVEDRGPGIDAADRERVLEPYVRLEPSRGRQTGGSGLGLAIVRAIARGHDGDVELKPRPGGGLSAVVTLARTTRDAPKPGR